MSFCRTCGAENADSSSFCSSCGHQLDVMPAGVQRHATPKCTCCGYVGEWKLEPFFRPYQIALGIFFLFLGVVPGLIYFGVFSIVRSSSENRAKVCPNCKARNLWTFFY